MFLSKLSYVDVVSSPKVIEVPHSLDTVIRSKTVFTCGFEVSTDNEITQIIPFTKFLQGWFKMYSLCISFLTYNEQLAL